MSYVKPLLRPSPRINIAHPSTHPADWPPPIQLGLSVYLGVRMGIAEHKDDNKKAFSFSLTVEDNAAIQAVLTKSNGDRLIAAIGDCGAEYR